MKNVLEWLEQTLPGHEDQIVYEDHDSAITFAELANMAKRIGCCLAEALTDQAPVAVFGSRCCTTPGIFLGVVYSGRAYAPLDCKQPKERLQKILNNMKPSAIVYDDACKEDVMNLAGDLQTEEIRLFAVSDMLKTKIREELLKQIRKNMVSTDPLYIIYTSGSTGLPKGVMTSHDSLVRYIDAYASVMGIEESDCLGNQSPLDYIAAIRDIYLPLKTGCHSVIIPKEYFMDPNALFAYLNEHKVSSVGWSVSVFTVAAALGAFEESGLTDLKKICFSGSVMPARCLKIWQKNLPDALFVNQYGPTEATASCTYYVVDHEVEEDEVLPIGVPYDNYHVFILRDDGTLAGRNELGEICVSGPCLALGYYHDPERTNAAFIQNPANDAYQERIYRSGDIGLQREDGIFEFHGRRDRQIKHMGHRVELDEIELAANQIDGVDECCCIYQKEKEKLHLFYTGSADKRTVTLQLRDVLPGFMLPRGIRQLSEMPKLSNGKINMGMLKEMAESRRA